MQRRNDAPAKSTGRTHSPWKATATSLWQGVSGSRLRLDQPRQRISDDPSAAEITARNSGTGSLAVLAFMLAMLVVGSFLQAYLRPIAPTATSQRQLAVAQHRTAISRWSNDRMVRSLNRAQPHEAQAVLEELARRGELPLLVAQRHHQRPEIQALVPTVMATLGRPAHPFLPELADGLSSPDPTVRAETMAALRSLSRQFGPYRADASVATEGSAPITH